jgi:hypothetical protein
MQGLNAQHYHNAVSPATMFAQAPQSQNTEEKVQPPGYDG